MQSYFTYVSNCIEIMDICYEEQLFAVLALISNDTRKIIVGANKACKMTSTEH
jgi:hypothetical protein